MLDTIDPNPRAVPGDNNPPEPTALDTWAAHAESLRERSVGIVAKDEETAALVEELLNEAKQSLKGCEDALREARRPHIQAADALSGQYKPVIAIIKAVKDAATTVQGEWRDEQARRKAEAEAEARREREKAEEEARRLRAKTDETEADDLARLRKAEEATKRAKMAEKKVKATKVKSGGVRMMSRHSETITDLTANLRHIHAADLAALHDFAVQWNRKAVDGGATEIPGVEIERWKEAV